MEKVGAIVLAAGDSSRFGSPKPLLLYDREKTFIEKIIIEYLKFGCHDVVVVLNKATCDIMEESRLERIGAVARIVINKNPEYGRFYSLHLGCKEISNSDFCFMQNVDNPFVDSKLLELIYNDRSAGYTVPHYKGKGGHPVLFSALVVDVIKKESNYELNIKEFLQRFKKKTIDIDNEIVLTNINTPEDYKKYLDKSCEEHIRRNIIHL